MTDHAVPLFTEVSGVAVKVDPSINLVADNFDASDSHGVNITVWTNSEDFSAMGYVVDQLDSLIDEWFPGERVWKGKGGEGRGGRGEEGKAREWEEEVDGGGNQKL